MHPLVKRQTIERPINSRNNSKKKQYNNDSLKVNLKI